MIFVLRDTGERRLDTTLATPIKDRKNSLHPEVEKKILAEVREDEIVTMARDVINIPSPTGEELQMAQYMQSALQKLGLTVTWQEVEDGRANVVGRWTGLGGGKNLMFNGHMDTSNTGREDFLTGLGYKPNAVVKDGFLYGLGIYNMKGALVCYTHAVKALQRAGLRLKGDVIVAAVAGEIEKTQWGEFRGKEYRGYGCGTHYLVNHGVLPDMCILGEPTDMHVVLEHFGSMWVRISCTGIYVHTAFCEGREEMNSIRRMHGLMEPILKWIGDWEAKASYGGKKAIVNLGGIRGGHAWRASRTPEKTDLFLDVRVPPTIPMNEARRDAQRLFLELEKRHPDFGLEFETYVSVPGARIDENHEMIQAIEANHERIMGKPAEREVVTWCSDASVLSRYGIETVNYGPSSGPRDKEGEKVKIQTLVDITKIYALTAAQLCGIAS
jgi:acetylornithine deacetylase/succinyl-diaminopimelate desuccinylase-like protein